MRRFLSGHGFTLIELLVVILVIGILIAVAAPSFLGQTDKAHDSVAKQYITTSWKQARLSATENGGLYPVFGTDPTVRLNVLLADLAANEPGLTVTAAPDYRAALGQEADYIVVDNDDSTDESPGYIAYNQSKSGKVYCIAGPNAGQQQINEAPDCPDVTDPDPDGDGVFNRYPLAVTLHGSGAGSVMSDIPGVDAAGDPSELLFCGDLCQVEFNPGAVVTLTATPESGSVFAGWAGDCGGTAPTCAVQMDTLHQATALFVAGDVGGSGDCDPNEAPCDPPVPPDNPNNECNIRPDACDSDKSALLAVRLAGNGQGYVGSGATPVDAGIPIVCRFDCASEYGEDATVTLTARAAKGSTFAGWSLGSGGVNCTGTGLCSITILAAQISQVKYVTATFTASSCNPASQVLKGVCQDGGGSGGGGPPVVPPSAGSCGLSGDPAGAGGGPANDHFSAAAALSGASGTVTGSLTGATVQNGGSPLESDQNDSNSLENQWNGYDGNRSVWYCWTAPTSGTFDFNTRGSVDFWGDGNWDSQNPVEFTIWTGTVWAYSGDDPDGLTAVGGNFQNDYDSSAARHYSKDSLTATGGTQYLFEVMNTYPRYGPDEGSFKLNWAQNLDPDGDGLTGSADNCPNAYNPGQENEYSTAFGGTDAGDACESPPGPPTPTVKYPLIYGAGSFGSVVNETDHMPLDDTYVDWRGDTQPYRTSSYGGGYTIAYPSPTLQASVLQTLNPASTKVAYVAPGNSHGRSFCENSRSDVYVTDVGNGGAFGAGTNLSSPLTGYSHSPVWVANDSIAFVNQPTCGSNGSIYRYDLLSSTLVSLGASPGPNPRDLSFNGVATIAFNATESATGQVHIYGISTAGGMATALTSAANYNLNPTYSNFGSLAYVHLGTSSISLIAGGAIIYTTSNVIADPKWSPNGSQILFAEKVAGIWKLYKVAVVSGVPTQVADKVPVVQSGYGGNLNSDGWGGYDWSSDGQTIAYIYAREGRGVNGGSVQRQGPLYIVNAATLTGAIDTGLSAHTDVGLVWQGQRPQ